MPATFLWFPVAWLEEYVYFCNMNKTYSDIKTLLVQSGTEANEAKAIALLLMEKVCGMSMTDVLTGRGDTTRTAQGQQALGMATQVAHGIPVQYVLGEADFCGMTFRVASGVLIPRPETEELVDWMVKDCQLPTGNAQRPTKRILDIGTGSGCIAIALAKLLPQAEVEAWDISPIALHIAQENAKRNNVKLKVAQVDVLSTLNDQDLTLNAYDCLVSNPPYVCEEEAREMEAHVLEYEPHLALFVPNNNPLLFYRKIGELALQLLHAGGQLYFEINRRFGHETVAMLRGMGYHDVELRKDSFGNDRMVRAIKPS